MARGARQTSDMPTQTVHPLVEQLRWMRSEFQRGLAGVTEADAARRFEPMNSIGWIAAHMAWQEQRQWLTRAQGVTPHPELDELAPNGGPATTPSLALVQGLWAAVAGASNGWLDGLTPGDLERDLPGAGPQRTIGSALLRVTYHGWFHLGEILAIRQVLGQTGLPEFAGNIDGEAPYRAG
jgi:hypothetical protein